MPVYWPADTYKGSPNNFDLKLNLTIPSLSQASELYEDLIMSPRRYEVFMLRFCISPVSAHNKGKGFDVCDVWSYYTKGFHTVGLLKKCTNYI